MMWELESPRQEIMTAVGFEPTQLALVELESTPLDHSGKLSLATLILRQFRIASACIAVLCLAGAMVWIL